MREGMTQDSVDQADYRGVMALVPTAVVVVTASDCEPVGVAVGSFVSISLRPPMVGFFIDVASSTWPRLERAGSFTVNILSERQSPLCHRFGQKDVDRFAGLVWSAGHEGSPRLDGAIAWIECDIDRVDEIGDHRLVVGLVRSLEVGESSEIDGPLLFHRRAYRAVRPGEVGLDDPGGHGRR